MELEDKIRERLAYHWGRLLNPIRENIDYELRDDIIGNINASVVQAPLRDNPFLMAGDQLYVIPHTMSHRMKIAFYVRNIAKALQQVGEHHIEDVVVEVIRHELGHVLYNDWSHRVGCDKQYDLKIFYENNKST